MTVVWIIAIVVALIVGRFMGMYTAVSRIKAGITDPKNVIAVKLKELADRMDENTSETFAKAAERYQERFPCPSNCGREIARMFRETSKELR